MFAATTPILFYSLLLSTPSSADYWQDRNAFIKLEESQMLGSSIVLTDKEQLANQILMTHKLIEYDSAFEDPGIFAPGRHFFQARADIEKSKVFGILQKLPKGAALHGHDTALVSYDYLYNLTHKDDLYACTVDGRLKLRFFPSLGHNKTCSWSSIDSLRRQNASYDEWVRSQLTLDVDNPREAYSDINVVWQALSDIFATVTPMLTYRPVFQEHFYQALQELYDDNVMYLEFRGTLPVVYELNGTTYGPVEVAAFYQETIDQFKIDHPDFLGARFIYGPSRRVDNETLDNYMEVLRELKIRYPRLLAGFDLVGQEDLGRPLADFIKQLEELPGGVDLFFHAAETNWFGSTTDLNIVDAVLLGTKRVGHGYGLVKHPLVMERVKKGKIALEVCPISNQVLMLVKDMRNHPAGYLMAQGYPVVISYDDPSFWSAKGLSYDFYMAFMGMAGRNADLKLLKQLAKNSLIYSSMLTKEKEAALKAWEVKWNEFIDQVLEDEDKEKGGSTTTDTNSLVLTIVNSIVVFVVLR